VQQVLKLPSLLASGIIKVPHTSELGSRAVLNGQYFASLYFIAGGSPLCNTNIHIYEYMDTYTHT
jgi:hypothetical protein